MLVENVSIHQFDANDAVKSGEQAILIHSYSDVEMKNVKINFTLTASGANIIKTSADSSSGIVGNAVITNTEIFIGNHNTAVFYLQGNSKVEGLKLELPHMRAAYIFEQALYKDLLIKDMELNATSASDKLSLF